MLQEIMVISTFTSLGGAVWRRPLPVQALAWIALGTAPLAHGDGPADPQTSVPVHAYRSIFMPTTPPVVEAAKPEDWPGLNATVGQFMRGHVDILRAEQAQRAGAERTDGNHTSHTHTSGDRP